MCCSLLCTDSRSIQFKSIRIQTCKMTSFTNALTGAVKSCEAPWNHHSMMPPLLKMTKSSSMFKMNVLLLIMFSRQNRANTVFTRLSGSFLKLHVIFGITACPWHTHKMFVTTFSINANTLLVK